MSTCVLFSRAVKLGCVLLPIGITMSLAAEAAASSPTGLAQTKNATAIKVDAPAPELGSLETQIWSRPPQTASLGPQPWTT